jgi:hypothetical protein
LPTEWQRNLLRLADKEKQRTEMRLMQVSLVDFIPLPDYWINIQYGTVN